MSTNINWIVYAPDAPDAHEQRATALAQHMAGLGPYVADGTIVLDGYMLSPASVAPGAPETDRKPIGGAVVIRAPTLEAVRAIVEADVLWTSHVVCHERLSIMPYVQLFPADAAPAPQ